MHFGSRAAVTASALACAVFGVTCSSTALGAPRHSHAHALRNVSAVTAAAPAAPAPPAAPVTEPPEEETAAAAPSFRWVIGHLPPGGRLEGGTVAHAVRHGDSWLSIAEAYLDLTSVYDPADLAKAIANANGGKLEEGKLVAIPHVLPHAPRSGAGGRIGLPKDGVMKGIYVRGVTAGAKSFPALLDRVRAHGMNAIVLDVKDYDGELTYPSKVALANESGAVKKPPIRSYARAVRFAHERGVRVIARVSCFNDQLMAKAHPSMAIRGVSGHPYRNGWVDPQNEKAQQYVVDLAKEAMDAGADEVQLDYVRFPVIGMKNIDFGFDSKKQPRAKVDVITRFVERVHSVTQSRGVPLSLDVFGVIAFGKDVDIQNLGQDPNELAKHSEFLSAMVYPSHYDPGFMGFAEPGAHPELVGLGVKHMLSEFEEHDVPKNHAKIRPWLQAMHHKSSNYGAGYIQDEIRTGDKAGATGWLLWNPGNVYDVAWRAVPAAPRMPHPKASGSTRPASATNVVHRHRG